MTNTKILEAICTMPIAYWKKQRGTMVQLFLESGYRDASNPPNVGDIERYLNAHPDLSEEWLNDSMDRRGSPAWYIKSHPENSGLWIVGYYPGGEEKHFDDKSAACAYYIIRYLEHLEVWIMSPEREALLNDAEE